MSRFKFDGISIELKSPDLNGDGRTGGTEVLTKRNDMIQPIVQPTELGETMRDFNDDILDPETRMSTIDMKSNINMWERNSLLALDYLRAAKFLPSSTQHLSRQLKRLNCSIKALRSGQIVDIISGKRDHDKKVNPSTGGFLDGLKNKMGMGK